MARAYIGIGSNIEPEKNIRAAVGALRQAFGSVLLSPVYETAAEGFDGPNFYNLAACIETQEPPLAVNRRLQEIENAQGRERIGSGWHSRTLDLDLLLYDSLILRDPQLQLPRDDIKRYAFVLKPLSDIAPDERHPETGLTLGEMWRRFPATGRDLRPVALKLAP